MNNQQLTINKFLTTITAFCLSLVLIISCTQVSKSNLTTSDDASPIVIGCSDSVAWWSWAIAEQAGLFAKNQINIQMKWFDSYSTSIAALTTGKIDGNCQTLNDTIAFAGDGVQELVVILVNDHSAGNDKIIVTDQINTIEDLKGKKVAVEEGIVSDFLLTLALESKGIKRQEVEIVPLNTPAAVAAFASGEVDGVSAFTPYWLTALKAEGAKELISSREFPKTITRLLVISQKLIEQQPMVAQGLVNTWFDILDFRQNHPEQAEAIMAAKAGIRAEELQLLQNDSQMFTWQDNLEAFSEGDSMKYLPFASSKIAKFMVDAGLSREVPNLNKLLNSRFVEAYAKNKQK